jgi:hypothetical protein
MGRTLVIAGLVLVAVGLLVMLLGRLGLPLGKLPHTLQPPGSVQLHPVAQGLLDYSQAASCLRHPLARLHQPHRFLLELQRVTATRPLRHFPVPFGY